MADETPTPVVVESTHGGLVARARGIELRVGRAGDDTFRSVELLLAALGTCMLGTMLLYANTASIDVTAASVELTPRLGGSPERVEHIEVTVRIEGDVPARRIAALGRAAAQCKVHSTLLHAPEIAVVIA